LTYFTSGFLRNRGFVVSVVKDLGLPVKFIGVGEKIDDLRDFEPELFVDALLGNNEETSMKMKARVDKMLNMEPMRALGNAMEDGKGTEGRLRASFGANSDDADEEEVPGSDKPKRAKRPKPQSSKPKKSKK
jgi:hypothetical protein